MPIPKARSTRGLTSQLTWPQPTMSSSQTKIPRDFQTSGLKSSRRCLVVLFCRILSYFDRFDYLWLILWSQISLNSPFVRLRYKAYEADKDPGRLKPATATMEYIGTGMTYQYHIITISTIIFTACKIRIYIYIIYHYHILIFNLASLTYQYDIDWHSTTW